METVYPVLLVLIIIATGFILKKGIKTLLRLLNRSYRSLPLWARITLLISVPFVLYIFLVEVYFPETIFDLEDMPIVHP